MSLLAFEKDLVAACHTAATCYQRHHFYCLPEQALQWREDEKSKWWFCTFQPCVNSQTARSEYKGNPPKIARSGSTNPAYFQRQTFPAEDCNTHLTRREATTSTGTQTQTPGRTAIGSSANTVTKTTTPSQRRNSSDTRKRKRATSHSSPTSSEKDSFHNRK